MAKMKISDAIRAGAQKHPQAFNVMYHRHGGTRVTASCALGAAAMGGLNLLDKRLRVKFARCPVCVDARLFSGSLADIIMHLNDQHHLTREAIADWVATVEPEITEVVEPITPPDAIFTPDFEGELVGV